jgi:hypothetical protein
MVMCLLSPIPAIDDARVIAAITTAETRTNGEIRVFVCSRKK